MSYKKYDEDEDVSIHERAKIADPSVQKLIDEAYAIIKRMDTDLKQVETMFAQVKKQQGEDALKTKEKIRKQLETSKDKDLADLQRTLKDLSSRIQGSQLPQQQKQMATQTCNNYQSNCRQKESLIQGYLTQFGKTLKNLEEQVQAHDPLSAARKLEIKYIEENVDEELGTVEHIARQAKDVRDLMGVMETEVQQQQATINIIDDKVGQADVKVVEAVKNLKVTRKHQASKNKWLWIGLGATMVLAVVLILVFVPK